MNNRDQKIESIKSLVKHLNEMTALYDKGKPIISDGQWDVFYAELKQLEEETGYYLPNSPTQSISYQVESELKRVKHNHPMLSLDKTKEIYELEAFAENHKILGMAKMDGLTLSLYYHEGRLISAETRGDGYEGEDVTHNAMVIPSIPKRIPVGGTVIIDGEIICRYKDFEEFSGEFENPRNFAAGSIRLLDSKECSKRKLTFVPWEVVQGVEGDLDEQLDTLVSFGFMPLPKMMVEFHNFPTVIGSISTNSKISSYPIDGVVFKYNSTWKRNNAGSTGHHPKHSLAYKFEDVSTKTKLLDITFDVSRTGMLCPVGIFEPVRIDGSTVSRASLHNLDILEETLGKYPYEGQGIEVIKANQIIPKISKADKNNTFILGAHKYIGIPLSCPVCGGDIEVTNTGDANVLICTNPDCGGKAVNRFNHFCGRSGLDIKGLSKSTLEKLIEWGWLEELSDIFKLKRHRDDWVNAQGFGEKSVDKILNSIEAAKNTTLESFITALGIPLFGAKASKDLCKYIESYEDLRDKVELDFDFSYWDGIGYAKSDALKNYDYWEADIAYNMLNVKNPDPKDNIAPKALLEGMSIVITGKLNYHKNRRELEEKIEKLGGETANGVTKKTNYLICNDPENVTRKIREAMNLSIPIISEKEFMEKYL